MSDKIYEQLSSLVDGELEQANGLVVKLSQDEVLQTRWTRYHLIRDVMTGHEQLLQTDISANVHRALENEPAILVPRRARKSQRQKTHFMLKQVGGLAIAASVSAVAVVSVQQYQQQPVVGPTLSSIQASQLQARAPGQFQAPQAQVRFVREMESQPLDKAVQSKLSNFIVNHNEYSVTSNMQGVLPYMRIVTVTPGERVMVRSENEK